MSLSVTPENPAIDFAFTVAEFAESVNPGVAGGGVGTPQLEFTENCLSGLKPAFPNDQQ